MCVALNNWYPVVGGFLGSFSNFCFFLEDPGTVVVVVVAAT